MNALQLTISMPDSVSISALREQLDTFEAMLPEGRNGTVAIRGKKLLLTTSDELTIAEVGS